LSNEDAFRSDPVVLVIASVELANIAPEIDGLAQESTLLEDDTGAP
jgi:hypothetical protein